MQAAAIGYLCKHNATLSAAEGGCQAEIGVASAMAAALIATAYDANPASSRTLRNQLEHHLGMTCDPVAGFVQVLLHRAMRIWRREGLDGVGDRQQRDRIEASGGSGRDDHGHGPDRQEMNSNTETSEAGLAVSVTLC